MLSERKNENDKKPASYTATLAASGVSAVALCPLDVVNVIINADDKAQLATKLKNVFHPRNAAQSLGISTTAMTVAWFAKPRLQAMMGIQDPFYSMLAASSGAATLSTLCVLPFSLGLTMNSVLPQPMPMVHNLNLLVHTFGMRGLYTSVVATVARNVTDFSLMFYLKDYALKDQIASPDLLAFVSGGLGGMASSAFNTTAMKVRLAALKTVKLAQPAPQPLPSTKAIMKQVCRENPFLFFAPRSVTVVALRSGLSTWMMTTLPNKIQKASVKVAAVPDAKNADSLDISMILQCIP